MKFKAMQLIIDNELPTLNDLKIIADKGLEYIKEYNSNCYKIYKKLYHEQYLWIYVEYDNVSLYNKFIYDNKDEEERRNPRKRNEIELRQQFFSCYDLETKRLYISDYEKKSFLKYYINETLQKNVAIKNIYSSLEDFENSISTLETIKFTQIDKLQNREVQSIFMAQTDILGFGLPERLKMQIDYSCGITGTVKGALQKVREKYRRGEFEDIVMIGKDDVGVEQSFDFSTVLSKIEIEVYKDEDSRYDQYDVWMNLKNVLREKYGKKS